MLPHRFVQSKSPSALDRGLMALDLLPGRGPGAYPVGVPCRSPLQGITAGQDVDRNLSGPEGKGQSMGRLGRRGSPAGVGSTPTSASVAGRRTATGCRPSVAAAAERPRTAPMTTSTARSAVEDGEHDVGSLDYRPLRG